MDFIFANSPISRNSWKFTLQKQILRKYLSPKYISRKNVILKDNTKILVSYIGISVSWSSAFYFLNRNKIHFLNRHLLIKVNSEEIFQFLRVQFCLNVLTYEFSKNFATRILQKRLDRHRIPTNIDVNESL